MMADLAHHELGEDVLLMEFKRITNKLAVFENVKVPTKLVVMMLLLMTYDHVGYEQD